MDTVADIVSVLPVVAVAAENVTADTLGAATTWKVLEPTAVEPAPLYAVTEQVPVPVPDVPTTAPE